MPRCVDAAILGYYARTTPWRATMSRTRQLRIAQIGCGARAPAHIAAMQASGAIDLVAICDRHDEKLQAMGTQFGVNRRYRDLTAMIAAEAPDLVNIVTRPEIRLPIVE